MATGYSSDKLRRLEDEFGHFLPAKPTLADLKKAPRATKLAFAGTDIGLLVYVGTGGKTAHIVFLNCLLAPTLLEGIAAGGYAHGWWSNPDKERTVSFAPD